MSEARPNPVLAASDLRLDAKAFRENTVYDSDGDPIRLIANAERMMAGADAIDALLCAARSLVSQAFDLYTARNGKRMSIEGDDGEKCWIVPFDAFEELRSMVAPAPTEGGK